MPNNTANDQPPAPPQIVRYAAIATGPFYNTSTPIPPADPVEAIRDAIKLQLDELDAVYLVRIVVTLTPNAEPTIAVDVTEYDGDEAERIAKEKTS